MSFIGYKPPGTWRPFIPKEAIDHAISLMENRQRKPSVEVAIVAADPSLMLPRITISARPCRYCGSKVRAEYQCRNCGAPDEHAHGPLMMAPMRIITA